MQSTPTFDEQAWDEAMAALEEAQLALEHGRIDEARTKTAAIVLALPPIIGDTHPDYGHALVVHGDVLAALGQVADATDAYRRALAIHDLYSGGDADVVRPLRVEALTRLGYQLALAGRYADAEALLREAQTEAEKVHGADAPEMAEHHNGLGVCLRFAARYDEAAAAYARAAALRDQAGHAQPATHFHNLSGLASARGDHAAAEAHARMAIAARGDQGGTGFELATDLAGLGDALVGLGRNAEADTAYREALALFATSARPDHPEVAYALHNHGDALAALGRHAEAEAAYQSAIARKTAALGREHYETAATLNNLAALWSDLGRHDEARVASDEAVAIVAATLPDDHPIRLGVEAFARRLR